MNCPHVQIIVSAFIDCELDAEEKREIRQHLVYCTECGAAYQELVEIKNCLQNITTMPLHFDPLQDLHLRLSNEERSLIRQLGKFFWLGRVGLVTACITAFFLSTYVLFPANQGSTNQLVTNFTKPNPATFGSPAFTPMAASSAPIDQDFSIDHPVTVYQASFVLP